jgi:hypothetical protein
MRIPEAVLASLSREINALVADTFDGKILNIEWDPQAHLYRCYSPCSASRGYLDADVTVKPLYVPFYCPDDRS